MLSDDRSFSLELIERLLKGMPGTPRIGFSFVDVRDVADLQIRAMTAPEAGGERFIAVARVPVDGRGRRGPARAPRRRRRRRCRSARVPDLLVRAMALFDPGVRSIVGQLGQRVELLEREGASAGLGAAPDRGDDRRLRPEPGRMRMS